MFGDSSVTGIVKCSRQALGIDSGLKVGSSLLKSVVHKVCLTTPTLRAPLLQTEAPYVDPPNQ